MHRILNTFPLFEDSIDLPTTIADPALPHARIIWLIRASTATQADFALRLLGEEPAESFHPTMAVVLSMSDDEIRNKWLRMEIDVAAKKVDANYAHIKKLCNHYSIVMSAKDRADDSFSFKFPHQKERTMVMHHDAFPMLLAKAAFPLVPVVVERYSRVKIDPKAARLVEEALTGMATNKRAKTAQD